MMMELVIAMFFLAIAVSAMLTVFASTQISLRNAGIEGTVVALAETQMENFRTLPYDEIRIDSSTVPADSTDIYHTANTTDASIPASGSQIDGGSIGSTLCANAPRPTAECAVQKVVGPDGRDYRIDTYVHEPGSVKTVTVVARIYENGNVGRIKGRASTSFDPAFTIHPT